MHAIQRDLFNLALPGLSYVPDLGLSILVHAVIFSKTLCSETILSETVFAETIIHEQTMRRRTVKLPWERKKGYASRFAMNYQIWFRFCISEIMLQKVGGKMFNFLLENICFIFYNVQHEARRQALPAVSKSRWQM